jgi:hypothetical protein
MMKLSVRIPHAMWEERCRLREEAVELTHLEVRRHPTWQTEARHCLTVPEYRVLSAERQRRRMLGVGVLLAIAAVIALVA